MPLAARQVETLRPYLPEVQWRQADAARRLAERVLAGRRVWIVNSSAVGGGVAQLIRTLAPYWMDTGADVRWLVLEAPGPFFRVTKGLHNLLHGHAFDGARLGPGDAALYDAISAAAAEPLLRLVREGDLVVLHDPQTAGLARPLAESGAIVVWRCHVGADTANAHAHAAWDFLAGRLASVRAAVFTIGAFVPEEMHATPTFLITPAIDPAAPRHAPMAVEERRRLLSAIGLTAGGQGPLALHLSRWDPLKDPVGVLRAFAEHTAGAAPGRLVLAGPDPAAIPDDPTAEETFAAVRDEWRALPHALRGRVELRCLPLSDRQYNERLVNALQRSAAVVLRKSLQEGFGLGVTEAMWKRVPVVASAVGGVRRQVESGRTGVLIDDPADLAGFGAAVADMLAHPGRARALGDAGHERARRQFLADRSVLAWMKLLGGLAASDSARSHAA